MRALLLLLCLHMAACTSLPAPEKVIAQQQGQAGRVNAALAEGPFKGMNDLALASESETHDYRATAMTLSPRDGGAGRQERSRFTCLYEGEVLDLKAYQGVSLSFIEADLRDVLLELSMMTGVSIVADDSVSGLISVTLLDRDLEQALNVVLSAGNFTFKAMTDHVLVGAPDPASPTFGLLSTTCLYKPEHVDPLTLASSLPGALRPYVTVPERARKLTLTAPGSVLQRLQASVMALDQAPDQVLLEMSIIEVSVDALSVLGVEMNTVQIDQLSPTGVRRLGLGEWRDVAESGANMTSFRAPARSLAESVQALKMAGEASIKAMPSIVTQDGIEANFASSNTVWIPYEVGKQELRRKEVTFGINMKVVPFIAPSGGVQLEIRDAEVSDLLVEEDGMPRVISHRIASTVDVRDGDTLVLGGLFQHKARRTEGGLPILSRMMLLGKLFGQERKHSKETEVLILIRPTILQG